ncbi:excitatory amino acid transporter 1-like [Vespa mandarinia]|uniref:excitatory amino acid transporter 1-like n=1 Tax=Vespa mandarinia TaxID=7446 RepID=UPI00161E48DB|nr:excitatory amino acid transporter 1-like [Vespa mandarinia]XP_035730828.1 excitatory amino acid transporter 1-like [Vespa mandarinia]XP_035730829.1 excitatory amino acid transporter 1-like [Vespa mandarinia]XP_035730830.1 excitatory amino acid transporter 1-like [Vespa mandarinia]XP_035730831.1 excitatory amino acid transporter 1-like [Vespa mandarinia]XP_035730832.1 excitatory amino acid transporter 1-like [Vespa mandarinia]XP_035730833.1 excitatory amino acid transporter 1-like [Vespa ma
MARPKRWKKCMSENLLTLLTIIGVCAGTLVGFILRNIDKPEGWTSREIMYIQFPGDLFLRMLKGLILPLIVASIVSSIGSLDLSLSGKIGMRSIYYYGTTTISAVILGIILVSVIRPGEISGDSFDDENDLTPIRNVTTTDTLLDLVRNVFPPNLVQACIMQYRTILTKPKNATDDTAIENWDISHVYTDGTNTLGLVVFGIVFGITLGKMRESGKALLDFFTALSEATMIITNWVIWISPIGVFFLVTSKLLEIKDISAVIGQLGLYFMTVLLGLFLHGFGTLSVIYFICTKELPFRVIGKMGQVLVTAFGTASSTATLPVTLQCLDNMGADPRITRFVVPIGATINMDGTALYEAVAAIFIAQVRGVSLTLSNIIGVSVTATAASIGAAGIPQAGLVTMVMVLDTIGLPAKDVTLIIAVDWLLDRFRTTINVMCDALGACIIEHMSKGELDVPALNQTEDSIELAQLRKAEA